jgi:hypothetical protein
MFYRDALQYFLQKISRKTPLYICTADNSRNRHGGPWPSFTWAVMTAPVPGKASIAKRLIIDVVQEPPQVTPRHNRRTATPASRTIKHRNHRDLPIAVVLHNYYDALP